MDAPSMGLWKKEIADSLGLERLTYIAKGKQWDFLNMWKSYMDREKEKEGKEEGFEVWMGV